MITEIAGGSNPKTTLIADFIGDKIIPMNNFLKCYFSLLFTMSSILIMCNCQSSIPSGRMNAGSFFHSQGT